MKQFGTFFTELPNMVGELVISIHDVIIKDKQWPLFVLDITYLEDTPTLLGEVKRFT